MELASCPWLKNCKQLKTCCLISGEKAKLDAPEDETKLRHPLKACFSRQKTKTSSQTVSAPASGAWKPLLYSHTATGGPKIQLVV